MDVTHNDPNISDEPLYVSSDRESSSGRADAFANFYRCELSGQVRRATVLIGDPHLARDLVHDALSRCTADGIAYGSLAPTCRLRYSIDVATRPAAPKDGCGPALSHPQIRPRSMTAYGTRC
jgi:hypothetical protein